MKNRFLLLAISLLAATLQLFAQSTDITILHSNDIHSRVLGFSPNADYTPFSLNDDHTRGGMARLKSMVDTLRQKDSNVCLVDAGDFLMGTIFQTLEPETGFQLQLMQEIGWDAIAIGNHEFDFGLDGLCDIIHAAKREGPIPPLLLSNLHFCDSLKEDDELKTLFDSGVISTYHIEERAGLRIAFFGLLGRDAYHSAPYAHPTTINDPVKTAIAMNRYLREEQQADIVIALSHSGVFKNEEGEYLLEDVDVANACPELDLIVSGHTHTTLHEALVVNGVPIVQTGAYNHYLGRTVLSYEKGETTLKTYELIPIDDRWPGNKTIQEMIEAQMAQIDREILGNLGFQANSIIAETAFPFLFNEEEMLYNSNLGPFIADALYAYYETLGERVDFTLVVAGLLRDEILPGENGAQCVSDLYRVLPLGRGLVNKNTPGYSIAKIYLTGREIKNLLEIMQIAPKLSTTNKPYFSGIRYHINRLRAPLDQVYQVEIASPEGGWKKIDLSKRDNTLYTLGANAYILEFVGMIKDLSKGLLNVVPKNRDGEPISDIAETLIDLDPKEKGLQEAKEWEALIHFCAGFEDINHNGIPDIPSRYSLHEMIVSEDNQRLTSDTMFLDRATNTLNLRSPIQTDTKSLQNLYRAGNGITAAVSTLLIVVLVLLFLFTRWVIRRIRR